MQLGVFLLELRTKSQDLSSISISDNLCDLLFRRIPTKSGGRHGGKLNSGAFSVQLRASLCISVE